ncbi:hypothetical protein SLA2020_103730 [Shorea laevis]
MFKTWKRDKKKIKVVFKLQFQATQVPKLKKSALTISLVPDDVGKPTLRLEKVAVQDGTCLWENPVYETMKLIRETKTGKLSEKIYHFIVSTGSSKSGFLGEASIDFADFAAETEPITVSLPLKFANSGAVLHVTVHRVLGDADQRYLEENEGLTLTQDGSLHNQESIYNVDGNDLNFAEDGDINMAIRQNGEENGSVRKKNMHRRSNTDWSAGSVSEGSLVESSNSNEETPREWREASNDSIEKLKSENVMLARQADLSELEVQSLRKQVTRENRRIQDLSQQIINLKEERDALKSEFEQFKSRNTEEAALESQLQAQNEDTAVLLEEIRQELDHEKELNANLRLQLQKTQDSNSNLILAVRDLNEMLEQKNEEISHLSSEIETSEAEHEKTVTELVKAQNDANEIDMLNKTVAELNSELEHYRKDKEELEMHIEQLSHEHEVLKQENYKISSQLEQNWLEESESKRVQNQYSESLATIKELESHVQILEDKIKQQSEEYSESLIAINELESQVKELKKEMEKQAQGFEVGMDDMIRSKTEQEQRAIHAEEALRKTEEALRTTRWKNAVTTERLQEEFKRVSVEMATKLDDNEKKYMEAVTEANELHVEKRNLEEKLQKAFDELGLVKDKGIKREQELLDQLDQAQKKEGEDNEIEKLIERWKKERDDLEKKITSAKNEADKAQEQLLTMGSLKNEKEIIISNLQSETENLRLECNEIKTSLIKEEMEKEKLRKQVVQLRNDLQKKEEEIKSIGKQKKNGQSAFRNLELSTRSSNSASPPPHNSKDITSLNKKLRLLKEQLKLKETTNSVPGKEGNISRMIEELQSSLEQLKNCQCFSADHSQKEAISAINNPELLKEVAFLKERNKTMENELKEMQERYSEISLNFAVVEGERQQLVMTVRNLKNGKKN